MIASFVPLKDLCENYKDDIVDGPFGANLKREHYQSEGIPVLKIQNIKAFRITQKKMDYVTLEKYEELKRHSYRSDDIIMTKLGDPLGESAIVDGINDGLIVADLVRIRANKIDTRYLCYHLNSPATNSYINAQQKGTTRPRVRISVVRDLPIFVPPLAEQKRIVAILDQAFADIDKARALTEQNLKNARKLFESTLQQVFAPRGEGWTEKPIAELGMVQTGSTPKTSDTGNFGDHIAFVKPGHFLDDGSIVLDDVGLSEKGRNQSRVIPENSVLMVCIGATIGKCGHVNQAVTCNQQINALTPTSELHHRFAYYQMLTPSFQRDVLERSGQATLPIINKKKWSSLKLAFPSYPTQVELVEQLDSIKQRSAELEVIYRAKLAALADLKQSVLQKALSGKLTKEPTEIVA